MIVAAKLTRRTSANGLWEIEDHVPLGTCYAIMPATAKDVTALHDSGVVHTARMVMTEDGQWLPTELLEWAGKGGQG